MRSSALVACISLASLAALGCSAGDASSTTGVSSMVQPIYKGTADTTTNAVMALSINLESGLVGSCSGTVVAVKGNSGYYLTAAHCVVAKDAKGNLTKTVLKPNQLYVIAGPDYMDPKAIYPVAEVKIHPSFSTTSLLYDFAMIRFTFTGAPPPVIPAMTPAEDTLKVGSQLDVIGYGQTDKDPQNSKRNRALMNISYITANGALVVLGEEDNSSITCQGDSGGPGMFGSGNAKRVATVTSFGFTEACNLDTAGVGRVSKVYNSFIKPFIDGSTGTLSCEECTNASTVPGGKCASQAEKCGEGTPCDKFLQCAGACADDSGCIAKCQQDNKEGALTYVAIIDCVCDIGCPAECGAEEFCQGNACGFNVSPEGYPNCNACVEANCCDVNKACFDDVNCNNCATSSNPGAACNSNAKYKAFLDCIGGSCGSECGSDGSAKCGFTSQTPACQTCFEEACCAELTACSNDTLCAECATGKKSGAECQGSKLFTDTFGCLNSQCAAACGGGDAKCGFTSQTPACQTCFEEACCAEFTACSNDTLCAECVTGKKSGAACQGNKAFVDAFGCLNSKCGAECGGGGSGGSGGSGAGGSLGSAGNNASGSGGSGQSGSTSSSGGTGTVGSSDGGSGTPGNGQGGSAAGGSESSPGGGTSGAGGAGTSAPAPGATTIDSKGDCTCQVPGSGAPIPGTPLAALAALGALLGCRRRGRIR